MIGLTLVVELLYDDENGDAQHGNNQQQSVSDAGTRSQTPVWATENAKCENAADERPQNQKENRRNNNDQETSPQIWPEGRQHNVSEGDRH